MSGNLSAEGVTEDGRTPGWLLGLCLFLLPFFGLVWLIQKIRGESREEDPKDPPLGYLVFWLLLAWLGELLGWPCRQKVGRVGHGG